MQNHTLQLPLLTIIRDDLPPIVPIDRPKVKDLTGQKFGKLSVMGYVGINPHGHARWLCYCDCGRYSVAARSGLIHGTTRSCGCLQKERTRERMTHGMTGTREYRIWSAMINRCTNQNAPQFKDYGGRGISICERWRHSFENFYVDMGPCPDKQHSIDRIDNDLGYSPDNCRWASRRTQANNTSRNRMLELNGEQRTVAQWARVLGFKPQTLTDRLHAGWSVERALTTPIKK